MKKIKVCHVVSGLKAGGVESMIYNYCSKMTDDYEFHILYQHEPSVKNVEEFSKIGFKLFRISSKIKHPIKNYIETYNYLKKNHIDIVHCHMTLMNFIPLIAAKRIGIKIRICHSHNSDVRKKNLLKKIIEKLLKKINIKYATHLVACGTDAGKYMYGNHKFIFLPNAMDLNKFEFNDEVRTKIRNKLKIEDDEFLIGHIGRFTDQKNHKFIININKKLKNKIKIVLIGDGENKQEIEKLVSKYKMNNVIFTGIISNPYDYYNAFDLLILPSLWEGLPVVSIEAQANGLNCIISSNVDQNAIIDFNKTILLPLEENKWIEKINKYTSKLDYDRKINLERFNKKLLNIDVEYLRLKKIYDGGDICEKNKVF